ncbi:alkaline phytoceramidase [Nitrosococcus wardiae]|uniref:Alkaline phytoceramidase n=1 Tax=Nitrosococcus wardiae TaxID=1814290 RepID=A0A4P7C3L9_9GAMM|nr:alkaline phytoceramidase [Nitrosococcus wardiae]QBQ55392.1 alkaline phytoceramidase [Nitrosococcus wardiae]
MLSHLQIRILWLLGIVVICGLGILFLDPIPQDPNYHRFADDRPYFGIPNFLNVISNLPLILVGIIGLGWTLRVRKVAPDPLLLLPYGIFFAGVFLTGMGSCYYHALPENKTLVWDRYPMTLAFMALFSAIWMEHVSRKGGIILLPGFLLLGFFSVWYWEYTERSGLGDLRLYGGVQFVPLLLIPFILAWFRSGYSKRHYFFYALGFYGLAKVLEHFDRELFQATGVVSGHSLKHLAAALAAFVILLMLCHRQFQEKPGRIL